MNWDPFFYQHFAGFESILPIWEPVAHHFKNGWPTIADFNTLAPEIGLEFIEQTLEMDYESTLFEKRYVPTRLENWHDLLNNLTWCMFPHSKWAMIQRSREHRQATRSRQRTPQQSLLAHFDECGILICSDDPTYFELIQQFEWKTFFWESASLLKHVKPIILGHGILEKGLNPYIGMTAKAIFLHVPSDFFTFSLKTQIQLADKVIAQHILSPLLPETPRALVPFPLLGWPHWHPDNDNEDFYNNKSYFRSRHASQVFQPMIIDLSR